MSDPKERVRVSVVIPHFNDVERLNVCLAELVEQTLERSEYEIIVVDNNSACGLDAVVAAVAGRARVILETEQGAGPARNSGAAAGSAEILAFTDSDCIPARDWLDKGLLRIATGDVIGGRVDVLAQTPGVLTPVEAFETVFAFDFERYITKERFTGSGNMFVHRSVFEKVGGFRKGLSEDVDWSHRAVAAGFRLTYAPDVVVQHPARRNWRELVAKWRRLTSETFEYSRERGRPRAMWALRSFGVLASSAAHVPKVVASRKLRSAGDRAGAIAVLIAIRTFRFFEMWRVLLRSLVRGQGQKPA